MGRLESFLDYQYKTIEVLHEKNQTLLVRDKLTGRLLVRRSLPLELAETYEKMQQLQHPNLVRILKVYRLEDSSVVLEEYVNGCSLAELIKKKKRLKKREARRILRAVCGGLAALHEQGLVCRNVRPDTIRMNQDGIVKLMDFSAVRQFDGKKARDTVLIGAPGYAAPEQYGFSESDERTDIYAAGILLNELLTGKHPNVCLYWRNRRLRKVIRTCTRIDKKKRYENAELLARAIGGSSKKVSRWDNRSWGFAQRFYGGLPALRSDAWYWKVIGLILYFILIIISYLIIVVEGAPGFTLAEWTRVLLMVAEVLLPVAIFFNAWNISRMSWLPQFVRPSFRLIFAAIAWLALEFIKEPFS